MMGCLHCNAIKMERRFHHYRHHNNNSIIICSLVERLMFGDNAIDGAHASD